MQKLSDKTVRLLFSTEEELFRSIVGENHPFRQLQAIIDFRSIVKPLRDAYSSLGCEGIDVEKGVKALVVQFWEDYSDRQMEKAIKENLAVRWFCGFSLAEDTPDYSYFSKLRKRLGEERISKLFDEVNSVLQKHHLFGNVFTFIDASTIISKIALWEERDKAIKDGEETLNNAVVNKYSQDKDAKWGAKSKNKIWFGYKRHAAVDMRFGLIIKTAITPANVPDFKKAKDLLPNEGAVFMDKIYDCREVDNALREKNCFAATIRKNSNQLKNKELDRFHSSVRMPFEGVFSKLSKRARYKGRIKVSLQCFMEAIAHNLKKAVKVLAWSPPDLAT